MSALNTAHQSFKTEAPKLSSRPAGRDKKEQDRLCNVEGSTVKQKVGNKQNDLRYEKTVVAAKASK